MPETEAPSLSEALFVPEPIPTPDEYVGPGDGREALKWWRKPAGDRLAIVGFAPSSMNDAPFKDESVEIWGVNELYIAVPRVTRLFEIHEYKHLTAKARNPNHLKWLQETKIPVYMRQVFEDIPQSIEFPYREIIRECGTDYFTNSISWLIGFALLHRGFKRIELYGIDMARSEEYESQRPSVEFFIGLARGRGIEIINPPQSDIMMSSTLYGIEDEKEQKIRAKLLARRREVQTMIGNLQRQEADVRARLNQAIGADQEIAQHIKAYLPLLDKEYWGNHVQALNGVGVNGDNRNQ